MAEYRFEREARTPYSEQWLIETEEHSIGRVDLHFTTSKTYGTLAVHQSLAEDAVEELIAEIDDRLVSTADEYREDFIVTVWRGEDFGTFSEESSESSDALGEPAATVSDDR